MALPKGLTFLSIYRLVRIAKARCMRACADLWVLGIGGPGVLGGHGGHGHGSGRGCVGGCGHCRGRGHMAAKASGAT